MSSQGNQKSSKLLTISNSKALFRFHDELNDFLPGHYKNLQIQYHFDGKPSIKDSIEAIGVPHTEVDLIVVNRNSVDFDYHLQDGDEALVYPVFNEVGISNKVKLKEKPEPVFIVDVNLGKLVKLLRMCGFDAIYSNKYTDHDIAELANGEKRIVLTRDRRLLKHGTITHGYWVRSTDPDQQIYEVIRRFDLFPIVKPFNRCLECNGLIKPVEKDEILDQLEPKTIQYFNEFYQCLVCKKIYWKGSHYEHMSKFLDNIKS
ncbi:MAG: Mut7-C ubiquitin/RNAse domain-containing protein [Deltaproteobacteria bacterium]|nr:Mut7-C ubiquitin/RNAse domain-containing protein [Deltaproteobacteria bacterium]